MYPAMTLKTKGEETQYVDAQPIYKTYGIPGTNLLSGYVSGKEQNPQLTGRNWVITAEDMLATDPIVKRSWAVVKQTLLSAKWIFKAGVLQESRLLFQRVVVLGRLIIMQKSMVSQKQKMDLKK